MIHTSVMPLFNMTETPLIEENRKQAEIAYYDRRARQWLSHNAQTWDTDVHNLKHTMFSSYRWLNKWLLKHCNGKKVLDYGCGNGIHSLTPIQGGARQVIGIDLSEASLEIAKKQADAAGMSDRVTFLKMDCEKMSFPDNTFDLILDGGTLYALNLHKAFSELSRVLKPDGKLICIETLGHHPLANVKRKLNVLFGKRTQLVVDNILTMSSFETVARYFQTIKINYFHLFVLCFIPFKKIPGMSSVIRFIDTFDSLLLKIPFLKKYAFKVVCILSKPKKDAILK